MKPRRMGICFLLVLFVAISLANFNLDAATSSEEEPTAKGASEEASSREPVRVLRIISADTVLVSVKGRRLLVGLRGVKAPEKDDPRCEEAEQCLLRLIKNKKTELAFGSPPEVERDDQGRLLAYLFADDENVNEQMTAAGWSGEASQLPAPRPEARTRLTPKPPPVLKQSLTTASSQKKSSGKAAKPDAATERVYITPRTKTYHRANCRLLRDVQAVPVLKTQAIRLGYKPCRRCKP
jgi:endonuclease YncB( thermonuclease family)